MSKILYSNINDPRIFVYRDENIEYGVTLNFAHKKSRVMMVVWLLLAVIPNVLTWVCSLRIVGIFLAFVYDLCLVIGIGVVSFRGASRDLKRHPGPRGPRA